jgi:hypothetical protein
MGTLAGRRPPTNRRRLASSSGIVGDTDDLFYDATRRRLYVSGGEGFVDVATG